MGLATLGDHLFRLDPASIAWDLRVKSSYTDTLGGRVVQVFGAEFGPMTIRGSFGRGGWQEQHAVLSKMIAIADAQAGATPGGGIMNPGAPIRFRYPPRGWDFAVYLISFSDGSGQITLTPGLNAPKWEIQLSIVEDNIDLKTVAIDAYLNRINKGLGWKASAYNGPLSIEEAQKAIQKEGASGGIDLIRKRTQTSSDSSSPDASAATPGAAPDNGTSQSSGPAGPGTQKYNPPAGINVARGTVSIDDMARMVIAVGIPPQNRAVAIAIAKRESGFNSTAHNFNLSTGDDSWGFYQINVLPNANPKYKTWDLTDPWTNIRIMFEMSGGGTNFEGPWYTRANGSVKIPPGWPSLDVTKYIPDAQAALKRVGG